MPGQGQGQGNGREGGNGPPGGTPPGFLRAHSQVGSPVQWLDRNGFLRGRVVNYDPGQYFMTKADTITHVMSGNANLNAQRVLLSRLSGMLRAGGTAYIVVRQNPNQSGRAVMFSLPVVRRSPNYVIYRLRR